MVLNPCLPAAHYFLVNALSFCFFVISFVVTTKNMIATMYR